MTGWGRSDDLSERSERWTCMTATEIAPIDLDHFDQPFRGNRVSGVTCDSALGECLRTAVT